jgi:hypothetical protein
MTYWKNKYICNAIDLDIWIRNIVLYRLANVLLIPLSWELLAERGKVLHISTACLINFNSYQWNSKTLQLDFYWIVEESDAVLKIVREIFNFITVYGHDLQYVTINGNIHIPLELVLWERWVGYKVRGNMQYKHISTITVTVSHRHMFFVFMLYCA